MFGICGTFALFTAIVAVTPGAPATQDNREHHVRGVVPASPSSRAPAPGKVAPKSDARDHRVWVAVPVLTTPRVPAPGAGTPKYVVEFQDQALGDAVRLLCTQTGENIVASAEARDVHVSLCL